jgi:hypothetical protein
MEQIPFWPAPADAAGGCSCSIGNVARKEVLISAQLTECSNNMTNLNQMSEADDMTNYAQACNCCAQSAILSAYVQNTILKEPLHYFHEPFSTNIL